MLLNYSDCTAGMHSVIFGKHTLCSSRCRPATAGVARAIISKATATWPLYMHIVYLQLAVCYNYCILQWNEYSCYTKPWVVDMSQLPQVIKQHNNYYAQRVVGLQFPSTLLFWFSMYSTCYHRCTHGHHCFLALTNNSFINSIPVCCHTYSVFNQFPQECRIYSLNRGTPCLRRFRQLATAQA